MILANVQQPGPLPACVSVVRALHCSRKSMWPRTRVELLTEYYVIRDEWSVSEVFQANRAVNDLPVEECPNRRH